MGSLNLGVVGYGSRASHMADSICQCDPEISLTAIADPRIDAVRLQLQESGVRGADSIKLYTSVEEMLDRERLDGVVIGTRCSLHAKMALEVLKRGLAVFLEKPVATNMTDLLALRVAMSDRVVVSFPLRTSALVKLAREIVDSGRIGTVEQVQAHCNVPYGAVYFQTWYRDENETQGMFLQKATHDFDYLNFLLAGNRPVEISAMTSKQIFKGNHPAGLMCKDCSERMTCFESPYHLSRSEPLALHLDAKEMCAFAVDTGNEDSGSALIRYDSGMHAVYTQNFFVKNKAASRGARLIGYHGTIEFDWFTDRLQVFMHHSARVDTHQFDGSEAHGGGDMDLAANFAQVMRGTARSISPLDEGVLNGLMCLKAKESAITHRFERIEFPEPAIPAGSTHLVPPIFSPSNRSPAEKLTYSGTD